MRKSGSVTSLPHGFPELIREVRGVIAFSAGQRHVAGFEEAGHRSTGPADQGPTLRVFSGSHGIGPVFACFFDLIGTRDGPYAVLFRDPVTMTSITRYSRHRLVT